MTTSKANYVSHWAHTEIILLALLYLFYRQSEYLEANSHKSLEKSWSLHFFLDTWLFFFFLMLTIQQHLWACVPYFQSRKTLCPMRDLTVPVLLDSSEPMFCHCTKRPPASSQVKLYMSLSLCSFQCALMISMRNTCQWHIQRARKGGTVLIQILKVMCKMCNVISRVPSQGPQSKAAKAKIIRHIKRSFVMTWKNIWVLSCRHSFS